MDKSLTRRAADLRARAFEQADALPAHLRLVPGLPGLLQLVADLLALVVDLAARIESLERTGEGE